MNNSPLYLNSNLDFRIYCPVCKADCGLDNGEILEKKESFACVYLMCQKCASMMITTVLFGTIGGVVITAMLTDLRLEDIKKLRKANPISVDDVIEIHKALEGKVSN